LGGGERFAQRKIKETSTSAKRKAKKNTFKILEKIPTTDTAEKKLVQ
jgi:hypothetical protein